MAYRRRILSKSLIAFSLLSSFSLKAFHLNDLNKPIASNHKPKIKIIDHDQNFDFQPYAQNLANSALEVASMQFSKSEFADSPMSKYDIDDIYMGLDESKDEFISLTKTYYLYPNKTPDFFSLETLNSDGYCKAAFDDKKRERRDEITVYSENERFLQKINVTVHFMSFDAKTGERKGGSDEQLARVLALAPLGTENLERVVSTFSNENEISFGSRGARTNNYYYRIGNKKGQQHTLHASIKVLSFKKEALYESGIPKSLKVWEQVHEKAAKNQREGTRDSLERLTKYIYKKLAKENEKKKKK